MEKGLNLNCAVLGAFDILCQGRAVLGTQGPQPRQ